jgi:transcriptional regulator with XRE-family HTH domain
MKTTTQWLDQAKKQHGISDYALAPKLGISRSQMSKYRGGGDFLSDDAAIKLAEILGMESPAEIIASAHAERSKSVEVKAFWSQWADKLSGVAASILLTSGLVGGLGASPDAQAAGSSPIDSSQKLQDIHRIKYARRRKDRFNPFSQMMMALIRC